MAWMFAAAALLCPMLAAAQAREASPTYPDRPIRLIVPFPPGGSTDGAARIIGQKLTELWGQQVLIDNRPGATGIVGSELGAKANPDGYTVLFGTIGSHSVNVSLFMLTYDPVRDFEPITMTAAVGNVLVVNAKSPIRSVKDLIAFARQKPGEPTFASSGIGGAPHLTGEFFALQTGTKMTHIPYKGGGPAMADLVGGNVTMSFASMTSALPFIKDGRLRPLAVSSRARSALLPDVPTMIEAGLPEFEVRDWQGMFVPRSTPKPIVDRLVKGVTTVLKQPDTIERFQVLGMEIIASSPDEFRQAIGTEIVRWAKVVKAANIKAE
ncbi:MAG: tripartite tricarboxylate transporter substrate binding protein [Proteobacteria bacterium]|nr:tripartite tricarboxylate transporter substrate binding protein [Burkholderiales bacterium]